MDEQGSLHVERAAIDAERRQVYGLKARGVDVDEKRGDHAWSGADKVKAEVGVTHRGNLSGPQHCPVAESIGTTITEHLHTVGEDIQVQSRGHRIRATETSEGVGVAAGVAVAVDGVDHRVHLDGPGGRRGRVSGHPVVAPGDMGDRTSAGVDLGAAASGEPVHEMWIRLTVDDNLVVQKVEASTEASPFNICPMITSGVASLKGERIAPGWSKAVHRAIGGVKGCTHINQMLLGPVATTAYQTIVPLNNSRNKNKKVASKPAIINTCHAFAADGAIVKSSWPDYYQGKD